MSLDYKRVADSALLRARHLVPHWLPRGKWGGSGEWKAFNPRRADRTLGSFSVNCRSGQWADFATNNRGGDLISLYAYLYNTSQHDACLVVAQECNESPSNVDYQPAEERDYNRIAHAQSLWDKSYAVNTGNMVTQYLRQRGLEMPIIPDSLRFNHCVKESETGQHFPAMIAKVVDVDGNFIGIHRTYLDKGGSKAKIPSPKKMLGEVSGGAVRLFEAGETLAIAEGIETALAVYELFDVPVWATLSAVGMRRVVLPPTIKQVYVAVDYDANAVGEAAGFELAHRLTKEGRTVRILHPKQRIGLLPEGSKGMDWLDVLTHNGEAHHGA